MPDQVYVVVGGDTLARIAARFGTTVQAIAARNGVQNVDRILVGQRLVIPAASFAGATGPHTVVTGGGASPAPPAPAQQVNPNAALQGDVVDFELQVGSARRVAYYSASMTSELRRNLIARGYDVQGSIDDSNLGTGTGQLFTSKGFIRGRVRINHAGHAHYEHVGQTIAGIAAALGYNVEGSRSELISTVRGGGGSGGSGGNNGNSINPNTNNKGGGNPKEFDLNTILSHPLLWIAVIGGIAAKVWSDR